MATEPLTEATLRSMIRDQRDRDDWRPGHRAWVAQVVQGYRDLHDPGRSSAASRSMIDTGDGVVSVRAYDRRRNGHVEHVGAYTRSVPEGDGGGGDVGLLGDAPGISGAGGAVVRPTAADQDANQDREWIGRPNLLADPVAPSRLQDVLPVTSGEAMVEGMPSIRLELAGRREACEAQQIRDEAICRSLVAPPFVRGGCWRMANERYAQCIRGGYVPPLLSGR